MRIVDLFTGVGGLTFGFYYNLVNGQFVRNNDCHIVFANELDDKAATAFQQNFPDVNMIKKDIKNLSRNEIKAFVGDEEIDLIIGGPPCQSYTTIGKRKYDDKAKLYNEYIRVLSIIKPRMFLLENVKGMLTMRNENDELIIDELIRRFAKINRKLGYSVKHKVLNAVDYGVPQHRERVFIVGIRKGVQLDWDFPTGTYGDTIPIVTVKDAISDLPMVNPGESSDCYTQPAINTYQALMRGKNTHLKYHFARVHGDKIQTVINNVIPGEGRDYINGLVDEGLLEEKYRLTSGYTNTYGRLVADHPCTTITNNMSVPSSLRCIHYQYDRALTPREGARIQSFPDWFEFNGVKENITTQIGNAVPPLLSLELARSFEGLQ